MLVSIVLEVILFDLVVVEMRLFVGCWVLIDEKGAALGVISKSRQSGCGAFGEGVFGQLVLCVFGVGVRRLWRKPDYFYLHPNTIKDVFILYTMFLLSGDTYLFNLNYPFNLFIDNKMVMILILCKKIKFIFIDILYRFF